MSSLSRRDRALAAAAVIGAAILVGLAATSAGGSGATSVPVEPLVIMLETLLWLTLAAAVLVMIAIVYALWPDPNRLYPQRKRSKLATLLYPLLPTLLAVAIIYFAGGRNGIPALQHLIRLTQTPAGRLARTSKTAASSAGGDVMWISLVLATLLVILFLGWFFWGGSRPTPAATHPKPSPKETVVDVLEDSIDALVAIADPRRAIIAAYAAMEASMARAGLGRRRAEAPMEFLARVVRSTLGVSSDADRLTHLFEVAKFSDHQIDEGMRSDALRALGRIRDQVALAAAP